MIYSIGLSSANLVAANTGQYNPLANKTSNNIFHQFESHKTTELQKIFTNCSAGSDLKIRSSVFIEAISLNYDLNDELKSKLVSKLDPDNVDLNYSKEELFLIFKDWICSGPSNDKLTQAPLSSTPLLPFTSTPRLLNGGLLKTRLTRTRLFEHVGDISSYKSENDVIDCSNNSSSAKKKLIHHQISLQKNIENYQSIASSLERKYEDANNICALQKLEIERLKQELKVRRETEQSMEEICEQRRKQEIETENKYLKSQSRVEDLEVMVANLKQDLEHQVSELAQLLEKGIKQEVELRSIHCDLAEKEIQCQELQNRVNTLELLMLDKEEMLKSIRKNNDALLNENYDLHNSISLLYTPHTMRDGIPLCDELPSEMVQFPVGSCAAEGDLSPFMAPLSPLPNLLSTCCQTETPPCSSTTCVRSSSCQTENVLSSEIKMLSSPLQSTSSQTELSKTRSNFSQTSCTNTVCLQSEIFPQSLQMSSSASQTELSKNINSSQTEYGFGMFPTCTQTEGLKTHSTFTQTEMFSTQSQTESPEMLSNISQTESRETNSSSTQTNIKRKLTSFAQTDNHDTMPNFTQTELFAVSPSYPQTEFLNCFPQPTEFVRTPHIGRRFQVSNGCSPICTWMDSSWSNQTSSFSLLNNIVGLIISCLSFFHRGNTLGRYLYYFMYRVVVILFSILVAFFAIFFTYFIVCQNNRCQLELRYPRGNPPV